MPLSTPAILRGMRPIELSFGSTSPMPTFSRARTRKLRRLYAKFKGTKLSDGKTFDDQVLEDLAEFRKRGVATGAKIEEIQRHFCQKCRLRQVFLCSIPNF